MGGKKLTVALVVGMLVVSLVASFSVVAGASSGVSGKLTIWSWGAGAEKEAREKAVEAFMKAHPELQIEHSVIPTADSVWDQKQAAAYSAGTAADVMQMSPDYYGLLSKYYEDLRPYVERDGINLEELITPGFLGGYYRPDGKLEAMPLLANCFVFAYNKELFDRFGVAYPTDDWTWEDFAEMAPKFVSGSGFNRTYFMVNHWVMPNFALICKGGIPYTPDFSTTMVHTEEVAAGLELFSYLINEVGAIPSDVAARSMPAEQLFIAGRAAIYPMGGFEIAALAEEIGDAFEWDAVLPPKISATGQNSNITYATGYAMYNGAKNKEAAWLFLKEVAFGNEEMAKATARVGMPANRKIAEEYWANLYNGPVPNRKYLEGMATSRLNPWGGALAAAGDFWGQLWEAVTIGGVPVKEAQAQYAPLIQKAFLEAFEALD